LAVLLVALAPLAARGCQRSGGGGSSDGPPQLRVLRVLAGSELADMQPIFDQAERVLGIMVIPTYTGSVEGARQVADGETEGTQDAVWFASDQFFGMWPGSRRMLAEQSPPLMRSPVILGLDSAALRRLGWSPLSVTWPKIIDAARSGQLRYGLTKPDHSNSGLASLLAVGTALADTGAPPTLEDVPALAPALREFFTGNVLQDESSRWLSNEYQRRVSRRDCDPDQSAPARPDDRVDGLFTYESELLRLRDDESVCLDLVYPVEGAVMADYRLTMLDGASDATRDTFDDLVDWLLTEEVQERIADETKRRPGSPTLPPSDLAFPPVAQIRFPTDPAVVKRLVELYRAQARPPSQMVFVLDTSGSMKPRMPKLRHALSELAGSDPNSPRTFYSFSPGERVVLLPFATEPGTPRQFVLPSTDARPVLTKIQQYVRTELKAGGKTATYSAVAEAYQIAQRWLAEAPAGAQRNTSIVLLTDGQTTCGKTLAEFEQFQSRLPVPVSTVPVHVIMFGAGEQAQPKWCEGQPPPAPSGGLRPGKTQWESEMNELARRTGGTLFDARVDELYKVFWSVRVNG
jgi:Ca-activated chloride channel family protein